MGAQDSYRSDSGGRQNHTKPSSYQATKRGVIDQLFGSYKYRNYEPTDAFLRCVNCFFFFFHSYQLDVLMPGAVIIRTIVNESIFYTY